MSVTTSTAGSASAGFHSTSPNLTPPTDPTPPRPAAPAARIPLPEPVPAGLEEQLEQLKRFNHDKLAQYNEEIEVEPSKRQSLEEAVAAVTNWTKLLRHLNKGQVPKPFARDVMKHIGFQVASLNRHYLVERAASPDPSAIPLNGVELLFTEKIGISLADLLARLRDLGLQPAHLSYVGYWLDNPEQLTFTTNPGERYFNYSVRRTTLDFAVAAELLKPIQS